MSSLKIKAVIFDMDGVLIDAKEWHYDALNRALSLFGFSISRYDHLSTFDGLPTRKKLELLSKDKGLPTQLHTLISELKQIYTMEIIHAKCKPIFQHEYALSRLKSEGYILGVASNSVRETVEVMMQKSHLGRYLADIVSNQDVKEPKPSPEIYLKAMQLLGTTPAETLVVEDNEHGIAAAKASGAHVMIVSDVHDVHYENIAAHLNRFSK